MKNLEQFSRLDMWYFEFMNHEKTRLRFYRKDLFDQHGHDYLIHFASLEDSALDQYVPSWARSIDTQLFEIDAKDILTAMEWLKTSPWMQAKPLIQKTFSASGI